MRIRFGQAIRSVPVWLWYLVVLAAPAALAYLPLASKLGLYADDWYLTLSGETRGIAYFWDIFAIDRPLRAFLVGGFYAIFGANAAWYSYTAYLFRVGSALALLWTLRMLWPRQRFATGVMALLFVLYPGFVDQVNAMDYQSHLASLFLALLSIALSVKAVQAGSLRKAAFMVLLSGLLALLYLGLMEYYIGLEGLRFLAIGLVVLRRTTGLHERIRRLALAWLPFGFAPVLFLLWRLFFFSGQRAATNITAMMADYAGSPVMRVLWTLVYLLRDVFNTLVVAWGLPLYQNAFNLRLRDFLLAAFFGLMAAALVTLVLQRLYADAEDAQERPCWIVEAALLGLLACILALAPVAFGDRHIVFPEFSRFTLTASAGGVILLGALIGSLRPRLVQMAVIGALVMAAVLSNYGNAQNRADETAEVRAFWHQVVWRAPEILPGTTLVINYPTTPIVEDYLVYAPANLIYYPEKTAEVSPQMALSAIVLDREAVIGILGGKSPQLVVQRGSSLVRDYGNILVMTAPARGSCVQILDGQHLELSSREDYNIMLVAQHSKIGNIDPTAEAAVPPAVIFGAGLERGWCYYYEKAALARQMKAWDEVVRLGEEALANDQRPIDRVEWMPFLQGYAQVGRDDMLRALAPILLEEPLLGKQVCQEARAEGGLYSGVTPEIQQEIERLFCE